MLVRLWVGRVGTPRGASWGSPRGTSWGRPVRHLGGAPFGGVVPPFADDLGAVDDDAFNLGDFAHYRESDEVARWRAQSHAQLGAALLEAAAPLEALAAVEAPLVVVSRLTNPFVNLALEDYIYNTMPFASATTAHNRLMFYVNLPCVVVGKNQNPWREANVPLLERLGIPLVRRKLGGGAVVHDGGNVNFLFMSSKSEFDRFRFARVVALAVSARARALAVTDRGDIVVAGTALKVSGSAYKMSRGRAYHHGTMLLSLRLEVLRQLLHRDERELGVVDAMTSIESVRSPVANVGMRNEEFIEAVTEAFGARGGAPVRLVVDDKTELPPQVRAEADALAAWSWRFGNTPKFSHRLHSEALGVAVAFSVDKHAIVDAVEVTASPEVQQSFAFLQQVVADGRGKPAAERLPYRGSAVAGFVTNDAVSDWLGMAIDGTV